VASTVAPCGEWMRALSKYKAARGCGNRTNALCAKINAKPATSLPSVTGRDANLPFRASGKDFIWAELRPGSEDNRRA